MPPNGSAHVVVIGNTGAGKSQLLNALSRDDTIFFVGDSAESVTRTTESKLCQVVMEGGARKPMVLTDTPGLGDSAGLDAERKIEMLQVLRDQKSIHCLLIVLNFTNPRFDKSLQQLVECIELEFGVGIWEFAALVFTHYEVSLSDDSSKSGPSNDDIKHAKQVEWSSAIKERLPALKEAFEERHLPCFFVDSKALLDDDADIEEKIASTNRRVSVMAELRKEQKSYSAQEADKLLIIVQARSAAAHRFSTARIGRPRIVRWADPVSLAWIVGEPAAVAPPQAENEPASYGLSLTGAASLEALGLCFDEATGTLSGNPRWFEVTEVTFVLIARNVAGDSDPWTLEGRSISLMYPRRVINEVQGEFRRNLLGLKDGLPLEDKARAEAEWSAGPELVWAAASAAVQHPGQCEELRSAFEQQRDTLWQAYLEVHRAHSEGQEQVHRVQSELQEQARRREEAELLAQRERLRLEELQDERRRREAEYARRQEEECIIIAEKDRQLKLQKQEARSTLSLVAILAAAILLYRALR